MIGCRSRDCFAPDRKSGFATELVQESGRLHGLPQPGVMAAPCRVGSPGSGPQVTPFTEMPSGEPVVELSTARSASVSAGRALLVQAHVRQFAHGRLDTEVELDWMGGTLGSGSGGRQLAWWSSGRE
ncbi:hypothetical protein BHM03_00057810 [Ensete ventricosum]|nr:hypothetical protein BHM03_00057810 [Ensete ventricosum]